jgi:hypothetical protein
MPAIQGPTLFVSDGNRIPGCMIVSSTGGMGMLAQNIPSIGTDGASPLFSWLESPADDDYEVWNTIVTGLTGGGTLTLYENGSLAYVGGADSITLQPWRGGVKVGSPRTISFDASGGASTITSITISPTTATGATTFTGTVSGTGSFSSAKTFSKVSGGGSINATTGAFTPPATTGSIQTIVVRVTSTQDATKYADATITIAAGTSTVTGVTVSPSTATIASGAQLDFNATVAGLFSPSQGVNWTSSAGSVDSAGLLTAPSVTVDTVVTVTATSQQNGSYSGFATVTVSAAVQEVIVAARFARPVSDVSKGAWTASTGSNLYAMIDDATADSSDYIAAATPSTALIALGPVTDPNTSANQVVRYQAWSISGGALTVTLKQGTTTIASWTHATLPTSPTVFAQSLTSGQCDAITDYTALRIELTAA